MRFAAGCFVFTSMIITASRAAGDLRLVARSGQDATLGEGILFDVLQSASLDNAGNVAFQALLKGPGVQSGNQESFWIQSPTGAPQLVARTGDPAPGFGAGVVFDRLALNYTRSGVAALRGHVRGLGIAEDNNEGIWIREPGGLRLLLRESMPIPGVSNAVMGTLGVPILHDAEQIYLTGKVRRPAGERSAILSFSSASNQLRIVAEEKQFAPGLNGAIINNLGGFAVNAQGRIAFTAELGGFGVDSFTRSSLWIEDALSGLKLVARAGQQAVGMDAGTNYRYFGSPTINDVGQIAFESTTFTSLMEPAHGIFSSWDATSIDNVLKSGDPAPGASGEAFLGFDTARFDASEKIAFTGWTVNYRHGVWQVDVGDGNVWPIALDGERAPGTPDNLVFNNFPPASLTVNRLGQVALFTQVAGAGVTDSNDSGIWATNLGGELRLLVRRGDLVEVAPNDLRTVADLPSAFFDIQGGGLPGFNDRGEFIFGARFTDDSFGLFVSDTVAVPEPSLVGTAWMSCGGVGLASRRVRRSIF